MTASPRGQGAVSPGVGVVVGAPRRWLGLEGLVLLAGALIAYGILGQPWWLVPAGILVPDLAMGGYLAEPVPARTCTTSRTPPSCQPSCWASATGKTTAWSRPSP